MGDDVVSVQVTAEVGEYVAAMKQAAGATTTSMDGIKAAVGAATAQASAALAQMRQEMEAVKATLVSSAQQSNELRGQVDDLTAQVKTLQAALDKGTPAVAGFGDSIRQAGSKIRSEGRFANFIARDIQSIIPTAGAAGQAVAGLVSGIAYGSGIAVAVSAVRLLVAAFKDTGGGIKQLSTDSAAALAKMKADVAEIIAAMNDPTQSGAKKRAEVDPREAKRDTSFQALEDAKAQLKVEEDIFDVEAAKGDASGGGVLAAQKKVELARQQLALDEGALRTAKDIVETLKQQEATHGDSETAAKINAQRLEAERQLQIQLQEINTQGLQGNEKIESEYVARDEQIKQAGLGRIKQILDEARGKDAQAQASADAAVAQAREATEAKVNANLQAYRRELTNFNTEELKKQATIESEFRLKQLEAAIAAQKAMDALNATNDKNLDERQKRLEKFNKDNEKSFVKDFIGPVTSASSSFFKGILLQQENVGDAIKSLFVGIAGAVIDGLAKMAEKAIISYVTETAAAKVQAVSTTQGNIAMAATAAASSVASTPFVGPALAAAAFAETVGVLEAGTAPLLSARGGLGSVPFDNMPAILHAREMVMPEPLASGARNLFSAFSNGTPTPSGGNGGGSGSGNSGAPIHVHVHEHYGPGVIVDQHSMDKHYSSPEFQTSIDRAIRTGKARFR